LTHSPVPLLLRVFGCTDVIIMLSPNNKEALSIAPVCLFA